MTLLGKIFTVLILIMSVVFMSFSIMVFQTHQNWHLLVDNENYSEEHSARFKAADCESRNEPIAN